MVIAKKKFRYYYWLIQEFLKKNLKLIMMTFLLSFIFVIGFVSLSPYLENFFFVKKQIIGLTGSYDLSNVPAEVISKISNGLVYVKPDGSVIPALASTWEVKDDGKIFLIHLKQNLIWNNGKKFTAYDVKYKFNDIKQTILDDHTLSFELKSKLPIFITYLSKPIVQNPLVGVGGLYRTGKINYKNESITEIYLLPNKKGIPTIIYKFFKTDDELVIAYKKGEITEFSSSKKSLIEQFYQWPNTKVTSNIDYTRLLTLYFNFKNPILKERDIRSAIRMGVDGSVFKDFGQRAIGPIPPTSWAYNIKIKPPIYEKDTAKEIISNNLSASESSSFNFYTYYDYSDLTDIIVGQLADIGIKPNINYLTQNLPENFDFLLAYWKIPDDPDQYYFWHSAQTETNISNYKNLKVDKLLEDGRNKLLIKDRVQIYQDFQKAVYDDPPALFLFYPNSYTITRK